MAKRVSSDEKLENIAKFLRKEMALYTLKDLEKKLPNACGIPSAKVVEFAKRAADENLIRVEKCGSSNIYWSFKNDQYHSHACEIDKALTGIEACQIENENKRKHIKATQVGRTESAERSMLK